MVGKIKQGSGLVKFIENINCFKSGRVYVQDNDELLPWHIELAYSSLAA